MRLQRYALPLAAMAGAFAAAAPASGATALTTSVDGTSGMYSDLGTAATIADSFDLSTLTAGELVKLTISASSTGTIDLSSVTFNKAAFDLGTTSAGVMGSIVATAGDINTLLINGSSTGEGVITGTFSVLSAVPEPGAWAMMILGFGAVGATIRRGKWLKGRIPA